jgi:hypothetical protein
MAGFRLFVQRYFEEKLSFAVIKKKKKSAVICFIHFSFSPERLRLCKTAGKQQDNGESIQTCVSN